MLQNLHLKNKETAVFHAELNLDVQGVWFKDGRQVMENDRTRVSKTFPTCDYFWHEYAKSKR